MTDRNLIQDTYIRICRDGEFTMDWVHVAHLTGRVLNISAIQVWTAFPGMDRMKTIAAGTDPILKIDA